MTKEEFEEKAKSFGYSEGWISNAINAMHELNFKKEFNYSFEDIVIHELTQKEEENNKFVWSAGQTIIFRPEKSCKKVNMEYKEILQRYSYSSDKEIIQRISDCSGENERENRDIINSIVLWKINREVNIGHDLFNAIKNLKVDLSNFNDKTEEIKKTMLDLLNVDGIRIAMASTILKMFYPSVFPIIDQRAYRELMGKDMPTFYGIKANEKYMEHYYKYINDCHEYNKKVCPEIAFTDIDKLLYQLDLEKGNKVKY